MDNVVGLDIPFDDETTQDMTINNDGSGVDIETTARRILSNALEAAGKSPQAAQRESV